MPAPLRTFFSRSLRLARSPLAWAWAVALALTVFKLWLVTAQPLTAAANARHDDQLFITLADSILQGNWLGPYDQLTLSKGAAYPLFIAAAHLLHLPLPLAQHLLYGLACVAFTLAVAPAFRLRGLALFVYLVLLYNPMSFEAPIMARVLRQHLSTPATLFILAGFAGLWLHARSHYYIRLLWSLTAGVGLAASWLCREESSLLLPAALLLAGGAAWAHRPVWPRPPTWILLALPWAIWSGAITTVCALNHHYYHAWVTVEFRAAAFNDAYGSLLRVRPHEWHPYVPVARATRERLYRVSPAFAELRDYLEGEPGRLWASYGTGLTGKSAGEREIAGGWFMWALRDAVANAGHTRDARSALHFYRQLAAEVNAACADGRLDARPPRTGFIPPWHERYRQPLLSTLKDGARFLITFDQFYARPGPGTGDAAGQDLFRRVTRAELSPLEGQPPRFSPLDRSRFRLLEKIGAGYQKFNPALFWAGVVGALILLLWPGGAERAPLLLLLATLAGTVGLTLGAVALIHISSFPALLTGYFHGSYPLLLGFTTLALVGLIDLLWARAVRPARPVS